MACCISLLQSDALRRALDPRATRWIGFAQATHCHRPPELVNQSDSSTGHHPEDSQGDGAPDAPFRGDITEPFILANIADGKIAELACTSGMGGLPAHGPPPGHPNGAGSNCFLSFHVSPAPATSATPDLLQHIEGE